MGRSISSPDETQLNTEKRVENTTRRGNIFDKLRGVSSGDERLSNA